MDEFDEDEYVNEDTELDIDEDYNPMDDLSDIWHPDVADTLQFAY